MGPACLPSVRACVRTVSAAQCPPCSTGRGAPNRRDSPPSPAVLPARPPSTLGGARVGLAPGQEVADALTPYFPINPRFQPRRRLLFLRPSRL